MAAVQGTSLNLYDVASDLSATLIASISDSEARYLGYLNAVCPLGVANDNTIVAAGGPIIKLFSTAGGKLSEQATISVPYDWDAIDVALKDTLDLPPRTRDNVRSSFPMGIVCLDMDHDGVLDLVFTSYFGAGILYGSK